MTTNNPMISLELSLQQINVMIQLLHPYTDLYETLKTQAMNQIPQQNQQANSKDEKL